VTLTFDLESYFDIFLIPGIPFEWLCLAASFLVGRYIFRISRSHFSLKVMGLRSRSRQRKSGSMQLKNYWTEITGAGSEYFYDNARSTSELLTFWPWPLTLRHIFVFLIQAVSFECLMLAASFLVWGYSLEYPGHLRVSRSWGLCHGCKTAAARRFVLSSDTAVRVAASVWSLIVQSCISRKTHWRGFEWRLATYTQTEVTQLQTYVKLWCVLCCGVCKQASHKTFWPAEQVHTAGVVS